MPDFLTDANNAAMADITAMNAAPEAPAPVASPAPDPPAEATPPAPQAEEATPPAEGDTAQPTPPAEESGGQQKWVFTRKGQQVEISDPNQALELIRKGHDYTEKTMELANQRRQFEQQVQETARWIQDPRNLRSLLARVDPTFGQTTPPATPAPSQPSSPEPDDLVTQAQAQQLAAAQLQAAQQYAQQIAEQTIQQAMVRAETERYTQEYKGEVNRTLQTLLQEKFPILQDVEKIDKLILDDVGEIVRQKVLENPEEVVSIDEVKALLVENAQKRADRLNKRYADHQKMEVVRAAKLKQGIEPPGAAAPAPPPAKPLKLGSEALTNAVIAELQAAFDAKG